MAGPVKEFEVHPYVQVHDGQIQSLQKVDRVGRRADYRRRVRQRRAHGKARLLEAQRLPRRDFDVLRPVGGRRLHRRARRRERA